jgi:hypothetical protein
MALLLAWQFLTVHYNRDGNWTALFLTGTGFPPPAKLVAGTYLFPGSGYDGEFYRYVAHDLFLQRGYARFIDTPAVRYRRVLIPALALLFAAGHQSWIDTAYIAVVALFVFLGAYWLSRYAALAGRSPAWALAFLLVPATWIAMDRMTVDVAVAALTAGFAVYWKAGVRWKVYAVCVLAGLAHETGLLIAGGACLFELLQRRFARAALWASAALPLFVWAWNLRRIFPGGSYGVAGKFAGRIGGGVFSAVFLTHYPLPPALETIARIADAIGLAGILLASALVIVFLLRSRPLTAPVVSALLFVGMVLVLPVSDVWTDVNSYARVFSPLLILVALPSIAHTIPAPLPWWIGFVPTIGIDLRLGMEFTGSLGDIVRGLLHF